MGKREVRHEQGRRSHQASSQEDEAQQRHQQLPVQNRNPQTGAKSKEKKKRGASATSKNDLTFWFSGDGRGNLCIDGL